MLYPYIRHIRQSHKLRPHPQKKITEIAMGPVICKIRNLGNGVPLGRANPFITLGRTSLEVHHNFHHQFVALGLLGQRGFFVEILFVVES